MTTAMLGVFVGATMPHLETDRGPGHVLAEPLVKAVDMIRDDMWQVNADMRRVRCILEARHGGRR